MVRHECFLNDYLVRVNSSKRRGCSTSISQSYLELIHTIAKEMGHNGPNKLKLILYNFVIFAISTQRFAHSADSNTNVTN
jgi:hypothetical protein